MAAHADTKDESLTATCSVCGSPAAAHLHYEAVACYSCRAFFRRGQPKQIRCIFGEGPCEISPHNRTNCKMCRYNKCLSVGMKPDKVDRFVAKRKEREVYLAAAEDDQLNIQEPNKCPASEDIFQQSQVSITLLNSLFSTSEGGKEQRENTRDSENIELNTFSNNTMGLFRNMETNHNATIVRENQDILTNIGNFQTEETPHSADYEQASSSMPGIIRNIQDNKKENFVRQQINLFQPKDNIPDCKHSTTQDDIWNIQSSSKVKYFARPFGSQEESEENDFERYDMASGSSSTINDGCESGGWWSRKVQGDQNCAQTLGNLGNKTSVIEGKYKCKNRDFMETISKPEVIIREVKKGDILERYENPSQNHDQYVYNPIKVLSHDKVNESFYRKISELKGKDMDTNTAYSRREHIPPHYYQPCTSVIQKNPQIMDQLKSKHAFDFYQGGVYQTVNKKEADIAYELEETSIRSGDFDEGETAANHMSIERFVNETTYNNSRKDEENQYYPNKTSWFQLKKRQRLMEIPYNTGHGINKKVLPVLSFTFEEEFRAMDYIVRIEQYQNRRFDFLTKNFHRYKELTVGFVACTQRGMKIPFNKALEEKLFSIGLEFTKQTSTKIFEEIGMLNEAERINVIKSTYPALYVVMWSILEGKTWMDQQMKSLHITKENHAAIKDSIQGLENVRSISLKDQERFTSPWALDVADEDKFERTVSLVGRLLRDDIQLQALYHMLVMMKPPETHPSIRQSDPTLVAVQNSLCQFIYRYLAAKDNTDLKYTKTDTSSPETGTSFCSSIMNKTVDLDDLNPAEKTSLLMNLVNDLHDCGDIMQNRSLLVQMEDLQPQQESDRAGDDQNI